MKRELKVLKGAAAEEAVVEVAEHFPMKRELKGHKADYITVDCYSSRALPYLKATRRTLKLQASIFLL